MDQDKLDKLIKDQVTKYKTPNDPDLLWQKIQAKQEGKKKKKRRFFFFWFFGGALLVGSLGLLYFMMFTTSTNDLDHERLSANEKLMENNSSADKTINHKSDLENAEDTKQMTDLSEKSRRSSNEITDKKKTTKFLTSSTSESMDSPTILQKNKSAVPENSLAATRTTTNSEFATTNKTTDITADKKINNAINNQPGIDQNKTKNQSANNSRNEEDQLEKENDISPTKKSDDIDATTTENSNEKEEKPENIVGNDLDNQRIVDKNELKSNPDLATAKNAMPIDSLFTKNEPTNGDSLFEKLPNNNFTKNKKQWSFSNGVALTYGQAFRTLSDRGTAPMDYLETRNNTETSLDAVRINIDSRLQHRSGFYFQSGLEYEQINERFDYYNEIDSTGTETDQLLAISFDMDSIPSEIRGIGEVGTIHWHRRKTYNRYRRIDIPILIGYNPVKTDKRFGWFVAAGVSVNLWFNATGEIMDTNGKRLQLTDNDDLFRKRTGISLLGSAGLTYKVSDKVSIWASPEIKANLNPITGEEGALDQRYVHVGLGVGVRYFW